MKIITSPTALFHYYCYYLVLTSQVNQTTGGKTSSSSISSSEAYTELSKILQKRLITTTGSNDGRQSFVETNDKHNNNYHYFKNHKSILSAIKEIEKSQSTLKKLDGAAYEAYQRTHSYKHGSMISSKKDLTSVDGRATRYARRLGCAADALLACELCEILELPKDEKAQALNIQLEQYGREVVWDREVSLDGRKNGSFPPLKVLCLWEKDFIGGAGIKHGGIHSLEASFSTTSENSNESQKRGRLLVIIADSFAYDLAKTIEYLDESPYPLQISAGLVAEEASVHEGLWRAAGKVIESIRDVVLLKSHTENINDKGEHDIEQRDPNDGSIVDDMEAVDDKMAAIHFLGRSLGGGVSTLAAAMLDGSLPCPNSHKKKKRKKYDELIDNSNIAEAGISSIELSLPTSSISGYGRGRTSAFVLGAPPTLSANIRAAFVTALIHGDDIICRTTQVSIDRLCDRTEQAMKRGLLTKNIGWMADAVSLTVSNLKSHAKGSEGEEAKLSVAGTKYYVKPRRLGDACSLHTVGEVSGTEAIRASVLWQLDDILLSKSMWSHHGLTSYIKAVDRIQLKAIEHEEF